jgi:hypothetical protein
MVCQNQPVDDSEASLARDLRLLVRGPIAAGDSDAQVIDFLVARYGKFVLPRTDLTDATELQRRRRRGRDRSFMTAMRCRHAESSCNFDLSLKI